jgi:hypothetical protein
VAFQAMYYTVPVAGEPHSVGHELWTLKALRSFDQNDGRRRLQDLIEGLGPVSADGTERWMTCPGRDDGVIRILPKIVCGYSDFRRLESAAPVIDVEAMVRGRRRLADVLDAVADRCRQSGARFAGGPIVARSGR